jgi:dTDP-4-dehydrorhamnose reductase
VRVLVTGVKGQLGYDVVNELTKRGHEAVGVDIDEMDITDAISVQHVVSAANVDSLVHCAAYTAVDKAEDFPEICMKVNVEGTRNIAKACSELDLKMIYISTDYVFSGVGEEPFGEYDSKGPTNIYGKSKLEGEFAVIELVAKHFIVRISWAFGFNGNNFVKTMLKLGKERGSVSVVDDQVGSPTYTYDVAQLLVDMLETEKYGVYHATNEGYCSWYDFACEIFKYSTLDVEVKPVDSSKFPVKAIRPKNSRLSKMELDRNGFRRLPHWKDALHRYLGLLSEAKNN